MSSDIIMSEKKKALIAYKQKILAELKYYDARIEEISSCRSKASYFEDTDSSDSEPEFPLNLDLGPSATELKLQQTTLRTCMQATQELTNLQVLQSENNVLVDEPVFEGEPPVLEPGLWREVTAECRVDLVPFSISFCVHQPARSFAPRRYRGLQATAVKAAHAAELVKSILPSLSCPGDAVEVLKSYSTAHRSRRNTLARLADKYASKLYMEPRTDGGYLLKCANLLEVSWTLENKWSPIAPFHHRMKFDLEYMDESYIKIITQAHRQLSDPSLETDERTFLLSKIISTCLEAQGPTQELYESMSSDPETEHSLRKRRTTLDEEPEVPAVKKNRDREVMAPPKSLPKKAKPKGKENMVDNRKSKKSGEDDVGYVKRLKASNAEVKEADDNNGGSSNNDNLSVDMDKVVKVNSVAKENNSEVVEESDVVNVVNKNTKLTIKRNKVGKAGVAYNDKDNDTARDMNKNIKTIPTTNKVSQADVATEKSNVAKNVEDYDTAKVVNRNTEPVPDKNKVSKAKNIATEQNKKAVNDINTAKTLNKNTKSIPNKDKLGKAKNVATDKNAEIVKEIDIAKGVNENKKPVSNKDKLGKAKNVATDKNAEIVKETDIAKDVNENKKPVSNKDKVSKVATGKVVKGTDKDSNKNNKANPKTDKVSKASNIATDKNIETKNPKDSDTAKDLLKNTKLTSKTDKGGKLNDIGAEKNNKALTESDSAKGSNKNTKANSNNDTNNEENNVANAKKSLQKQVNPKSAEKKVIKETTKSDITKTIKESVSTKTNADKLEIAKKSGQKQLKHKLTSKNIEKANTVQNKDFEKEKTVKGSAKNDKVEAQKHVAISKNINAPVNTKKISKDIVKPSASTSKQNANIEQSKKTTNLKQNAKTDGIASTKKALPTKTVSKQVPIKENNETNKNATNDTENTVEKVTEKSENVASLKRKSNLAEIDHADKNVAIPKKPKLTKPEAVAQKNDKYFDKMKDNRLKQTIKLQNKEIIGNNVKKITSGTVKGLKTGNMIHRVLSAGNISRHSADQISKIPPKKRRSAVSEANLKKNPLRISPRKLPKVPSKFKTTTVFGNRQTVAQKKTSIPRLIKKP